jgi:Domain of unknown function (DUF4252)
MIMKNILIAIMLLMVPAMAFSQNRTLNKFYRQHKREKGVQNAKVPGWLIRLGGKIAKKDVDEEQEKMAIDLLKKFGSVRFMFSEDGSKIKQEDVRKLHNNLLNENFDDLIMIRQGQMDVQIMVQELDGVIKNLLVLYNNPEDGEMAFVSAKANISLEALSEMIKVSMEVKMDDYFWEPEEDPVVEPVM